MGMVDTLKRINSTSLEAGAPMRIMFGEVTATAPLSVEVEKRFTISGDTLIVPRELRAGYFATHTHKVSVDGGEVVTREENRYGLQNGDKVILLRDAGGQQFLVVGRV